MKMKTGLFAILGISLFSCSDVSDDYSTAATELCECMKESAYDEGNTGNVKMNIGVCLLDVKVDLKNSEMTRELEDKCPEIKEGFEEFLKSM